MNIAIDTTPIGDNKAGIGYYTYELILNLLKYDKKNHYILLTNNLSTLDFLPKKGNFEVKDIKAKKANSIWILRAILYLKKNEIDLMISPFNFLFSLLFYPTVQVVYDLIPISHPQFFRLRPVIVFNLLMKFCLPRAYKIATISEATQKEILKRWPCLRKKTTIIGMGINRAALTNLNKKELKRVKNKYKLPSDFILCVNTLEPRKNHANSILAFYKVLKTHPNLKYVIVGKKGWFYNKIFETVKDLGLEKNVLFLGYVPDEDIQAIYAQSKLYLMVSFAEGFGMSIIEALSRNKNVVASDIAVFKEIKPNENIFFTPPGDPLKISEMIEMALTKKAVSTRIKILNNYSWEGVVKKLLKIFAT